MEAVPREGKGTVTSKILPDASFAVSERVARKEAPRLLPPSRCPPQAPGSAPPCPGQSRPRNWSQSQGFLQEDRPDWVPCQAFTLCPGCKVIGSCRGGCPLLRKSLHGPWLSPTRPCSPAPCSLPRSPSQDSRPSAYMWFHHGAPGSGADSVPRLRSQGYGFLPGTVPGTQ